MSAPAALARDTRIAFDQRDFERVRRLIHRQAGIHLHEGKHVMVYGRLVRRLRETGHQSFDAYLTRIEQTNADAQEMQAFVNCLTTNLTSFFREAHHFAILAQWLRERPPQRRTRLWCNAASTGEEPYSIAMTVAETLGPDAAVDLLCTDIDTHVLATAHVGIYRTDATGLDSGRRRQWFVRGVGTNLGTMRVKPQLRSMVRFAPFNLAVEPWDLGEPFDAVFCRNVMIYFDSTTQRHVLERMHRAMKPHALLFAGHSETFADAKDLFRLRGRTVYERL